MANQWSRLLWISWAGQRMKTSLHCWTRASKSVFKWPKIITPKCKRRWVLGQTVLEDHHQMTRAGLGVAQMPGSSTRASNYSCTPIVPRINSWPVTSVLSSKSLRRSAFHQCFKEEIKSERLLDLPPLIYRISHLLLQWLLADQDLPRSRVILWQICVVHLSNPVF